VVALNHDDCVDMVGHGDLRIDRHILVMTAQIFLLRFRKGADSRESHLPTDHLTENVFLLMAAYGDKIPAS